MKNVTYVFSGILTGLLLSAKMAGPTTCFHSYKSGEARDATSKQNAQRYLGMYDYTLIISSVLSAYGDFINRDSCFKISKLFMENHTET